MRPLLSSHHSSRRHCSPRSDHHPRLALSTPIPVSDASKNKSISYASAWLRSLTILPSPAARTGGRLPFRPARLPPPAPAACATASAAAAPACSPNRPRGEAGVQEGKPRLRVSGAGAARGAARLVVRPMIVSSACREGVRNWTRMRPKEALGGKLPGKLLFE
eukprot:scaffold3340_cov114-Isochrysis_galbana.AAC.5